jgi:hypothetical protein
MASAQYKTPIVVEAAIARMVELQKAWDETRETFIQKYMLQDLTFGSLWWKTTRKAYREEAEHKYQKGYWPFDDDPWRGFNYPMQQTHREHYSSKIEKARRIMEMGEVTPAPSTITLSEDEVMFLRLALKEEKAA